MLTLQTERRIHVAAAVLTAGVLVWSTQPRRGVVGGIALLVFVATVPGWATISISPLRVTAHARFALAVAFSLAITTLLVTVGLWLSWWQPQLMLHALGVLSFLGLAVALTRSQP